MAKLKQFSLLTYYRGFELNVMCVTSSQKKFAELLGRNVSEVRNYAYSYEPRNQECIDNPSKLFAQIGLGGEGRDIFDKDKVLPLIEYKAMIDRHRETYSSYRDYLEKNSNA